MVTGSTRGAPVHYMAWVGIVMAVASGVLALYGSMHAEKHIAGSPLREARSPSAVPPKPGSAVERLLTRGETSVLGGDIDSKMLALTTRSKVANYTLQLFVYVLPFFLGLAGALTGGWAMKVVQQPGGKYAGNTLAVFAMLVGGLGAVVAGCMMISLYLWPLVPSLYTT